MIQSKLSSLSLSLSPAQPSGLHILVVQESRLMSGSLFPLLAPSYSTLLYSTSGMEWIMLCYAMYPILHEKVTLTTMHRTNLGGSCNLLGTWDGSPPTPHHTTEHYIYYYFSSKGI